MRTTYEEILIGLFDIYVEEIEFDDATTKGLIVNRCIGISKTLSEREKLCVLAEELGHLSTSSGNIIDLSNIYNLRQEKKARGWAFNYLAPLAEIKNLIKYKCRNKYELSEELGVTEDFIEEACNYYIATFGEHIFDLEDNGDFTA